MWNAAESTHLCLIDGMYYVSYIHKLWTSTFTNVHVLWIYNHILSNVCKGCAVVVCTYHCSIIKALHLSSHKLLFHELIISTCLWACSNSPCNSASSFFIVPMDLYSRARGFKTSTTYNQLYKSENRLNKQY